MEPGAPTSRPIPMRSLALFVAALVVPLSLAACGAGDNHLATDPGPTTATGSPTASPTASPTSSPSSSPTVGTYPQFEPTDYTFELTVSCFCAPAAVPIEVTVVNAEVVGAVYGVDSTGRVHVHAGDPADKAFWVTINDIIEKANDTTADRVKVDWPTGQDYPSSVFVDPSKQIADEEIGYTIAKVQLG